MKPLVLVHPRIAKAIRRGDRDLVAIVSPGDPGESPGWVPIDELCSYLDSYRKNKAEPPAFSEWRYFGVLDEYDSVEDYLAGAPTALFTAEVWDELRRVVPAVEPKLQA